MAVPILKQGNYLIASIQSALSDSEVLELRDDLAERIGRHRSRGIIVDVAALDVIDSFVARSLRTIALTAQLRGAATVIVGIQPDVAMAMVQFRLNLEPLHTALDLEEALALLDRFATATGRRTGSASGCRARGGSWTTSGSTPRWAGARRWRCASGGCATSSNGCGRRGRPADE